MENKPFVTSVGGENNNTAGRDINIIFTQVDSTPCSNPYCDDIIAVEKAEIRDGLCGSCYKDITNRKLSQIGKKHLDIKGYVFMALLFIGAAHMIINQILKTFHSPTFLPLMPEFWVGFVGLMYLFYKVFKEQKQLESKRDLYKKINQPNSE